MSDSSYSQSILCQPVVVHATNDSIKLRFAHLRRLALDTRMALSQPRNGSMQPFSYLGGPASIRNSLFRAQSMSVIPVPLAPRRAGAFPTMQAASAVRHGRLLARRACPRLCSASRRVRWIAPRIAILQPTKRRLVVAHFYPSPHPRCASAAAR